MISRVPGGEYAPAAVESRLRDPTWVADHGVRHERVIAWFVDHAQILPARLLSLYSSPAALAEAAAGQAARIAGELDR